MAKYFNCARAPAIVCEALQCHGGNGFIEENPMARLYREAPLNSVWEGTSNMMCMDVRRADIFFSTRLGGGDWGTSLGTMTGAAGIMSGVGAGKGAGTGARTGAGASNRKLAAERVVARARNDA